MYSTTIIDTFYKNGNLLIQHLNDTQELSMSFEAANNFRKTLLLSVASYFEDEICTIVRESARSHNVNELILSFIQHKAIDRQYHTYFQWENDNATKFYALFGDNFREKMKKKVKNDKDLDNAVRAFMSLGRERNEAVHQNFAEFQLEKTADEIYALYKKALKFIEILRQELVPHEQI